MDRDTAIKLGLGLMTEKYGVDASAVIPQFVHILYDSDNGLISDEEIYDPDADGTTPECEEDIDGPESLVEEAAEIRSHMMYVVERMDNFIDKSDYKEEPETELNPEQPEPRIIRRKKADKLRLEITGEWMEEHEDGTFDRFASVIKADGLEVVVRLALISYEEGKQVKVAYGEVD